ncbi:coiled-coil domain-containing protein 178 [Aplochiton taeniatus]
MGSRELQAVCASRRRSCALVNTPSPCVNKAVCHIQELKRKLENWCQQQNVHAVESGPWSPLKKETTDVLMEVVHLVERLETDRQDAKEVLQTETEKRRTLEKKVDSIMLWKQMEFPVAVQKEHEACARDISELKWHLKLRGEKLIQVKDKYNQAEVLNKRLHEDITFVEKHGPLVKEKLQLESRVMNQIQMAQEEAHNTFAKTTNDLNRTEEEVKKLRLQIKVEEGMMAHELKTIRNQLNERLAELKELQAIWDRSCKKMQDAEEQAIFKKEQCDAMLDRIPGLEVHEARVNDRRQALETEESHLEEVFRKKRQELMTLHADNKENELEFEDYNKKIHDSQQAVKQLHKDRKRMLLKINQNEVQRDQAKSELSQAAAHHNATKARVELQEQHTFLEEQRMRNKIAMIQDELRNERTNSELAKQEVQKELENAVSTTNDLEIELEKLMKIYSEKSKNIEALTNRLTEINNELKRTSNSLEQERYLKLDHLNKVKGDYRAVTERFSYTLNRTGKLAAMSKEYTATSERMEKMAEDMPDVVNELQSVFDAVTFKHQSASLIMSTLQSDVTSCQQRTEQSVHTHALLFSERQKKMEDIKSELKNGLRENVELAEEYRELQKAVMVAKREAACVYNRKNQVETSFHEHKQLSLLQERMHKAMGKYFKQRSLYSQAGLAQCQALSVENNQKIKTVQEELSRVIRRISAFLHSLTDDSTTGGGGGGGGGAANKQAGRDAAGLSKKLPPLQIAV